MVKNALVVHICAALEVILYSRRLLQIFVHYGLIMAFFVEDTLSSTRSYIVNLASPPIFIPHPNQHTNRISLSYTLAYAIYCGQMMHIWRLRFTLIWTIVRQSICKKWTRLAFWRGFAGFWFELGTDFYVAFVPDSQRSLINSQPVQRCFILDSWLTYYKGHARPKVRAGPLSTIYKKKQNH